MIMRTMAFPRRKPGVDEEVAMCATYFCGVLSGPRFAGLRVKRKIVSSQPPVTPSGGSPPCGLGFGTDSPRLSLVSSVVGPPSPTIYRR